MVGVSEGGVHVRHPTPPRLTSQNNSKSANSLYNNTGFPKEPLEIYTTKRKLFPFHGGV